MKRNRIIKIITVILLVMMIVSVCLIPASAYSKKEYKARKMARIQNNKEVKVTQNFDKGATISNHINGNKIYINMPDPDQAWILQSSTNPSHGYQTLSATAEVINSLNSLLNDDIGSWDKLESIMSMGSSIAMLCGPTGQMIAGSLEVVTAITNLIEASMGGLPPRSEVLDVEDRLTQQFTEVKSQLWDIERQINHISDDITASTNTIVNTITSQFDNAEAKAQLSSFMLSSGKYDFGYNLYRNYIYGTAENNERANTAYYSLLKNSIMNGAPESETLYYYDRLYMAIMDNREAFYDALIGTETGKSIVQYYYDAVSANSALVDNGMSAEEMTVLFAYDLYQTEYMANQIILACEVEYLRYMLMNNTDRYELPDGTVILKADILGTNGDSMSKQIMTRQEKTDKRFAEDLIYVFSPEDYYLVELKDGLIYEVENVGDATFGYILPEDTKYVYLGTVPQWACQTIGFDVDDFGTVGFNVKDGMIVMSDEIDAINVSFTFKGDTVSTLSLTVSENTPFMGGDGTVENPYLVATANQFFSIGNDLDKHYMLIDDIDFEGATMTTFGTIFNSDGSMSYESFTGTIEGRGYTLKNLNVIGYDYTGLFAKIDGAIADLKLKNVKVSATLYDAKTSPAKFYAGMITGENNGTLKYIEIDSDAEKEDITFNKETCNTYKHGLFFDLDNNNFDREIFVYSGIIAGVNEGEIACSRIARVRLDARVTHYFAGQNPKNNKVHIYAGGICANNNGKIGYCYLASTVDFFGKMRLYAEADDFVNGIRGDLYYGGICAFTDNIENVENVKTDLDVNSSFKFDRDADNKSDYGCGFKIRAQWDTYISDRANYDDIKCDDLAQMLEDWFADDNVEVDFGSNAENDQYYVAGDTVTYEFKYDSEKSNDRHYIFENAKLGYTLDIYENGIAYLSSKDKQEELKYIKNIDGTISIISGALYKFSLLEIKCNLEEMTASAEVLNLFNDTNVKVYLEGEEINYEIIAVYGFDVQNESLEETTPDVYILFSVHIDGEDTTIYFTKHLNVTVGENKLEKVDVIGLKDSYKAGTFSLSGLKLGYTYAVGEYEEAFIVSGEATVEGDIMSFGEQTLTLKYKGMSIPFVIKVVCNHGGNFTDPDSGYKFSDEESVAPSCVALGKNVYICSTCGDVKGYNIEKTEHAPDDSLNNYKAATCTESGDTGDKVCACGMVLRKGSEIPPLNHNYQYESDTVHKCSVCGDVKSHSYFVTESVELVRNEDGSSSYKKVYTKTCTCKSGEGEYWQSIVNENELPPENDSIPTVVVTNGYVLNYGDEVVIYVRLENNPGVIGANFGVIYDDGLVLVDEDNGNIFSGSMVESATEVNQGKNFAWANDSSNYVASDGTLLKLTFRVLEGYEEKDSFTVKIVYDMDTTSDGKTIKGGFAFHGVKDGTTVKIPTVEGYIKVVERLPGDVNGDGCVNLFDATEIAKYLTTVGEHYVDEKYANVNISVSDNPGESNVDIYDIIAILNYISGSSGEALVTEDFSIILDYNTPSINDGKIDVSIYGENNTYAELPTPTLEGYKFLGWSYSMFGGELVEASDLVKYNRNQKRQTLYAQWELNSISFDSVGATHGSMDGIILYHGDSDKINVSIERKHEVEFVYRIIDMQKELEHTTRRWLYYTLIGWQDQYGVTYGSLSEAIALMNNGHTGALVLTPVWSDKATLDYPDASLVGYNYSWRNMHEESVIPGVNDADMIFGSADTPYVIRAKYTAIKYSFVIDKNLGELTIPEEELAYSKNKPYSLGAIKAERYGYTHSGWTLLIGNRVIKSGLPKDYSLEYVDGVEEGEIVTLCAEWTLNEYTLSFSYPDGKLISGTASVKFSAETDSLVTPTVEHYKYSSIIGLLHWCTDPYCKVQSNDCENRITADILKSTENNLTVYAVWESATILDSTNLKNTQIETDTKIVIIDLTQFKSDKSWGDYKIYIKDASVVHIMGYEGIIHSGISIYFENSKSSTAAISVYMDNVHIKDGSIVYRATSKASISLNLYSTNANSVEAGEGRIAIDGFYRLKLYGTGSLLVRGGRGTDGDKGKNVDMGGVSNNNAPEKDVAYDGDNGTDGAMAISSNTYVYVYSGSYEIYGGDGGNGGDGGDVLGLSDRDGYYDLPDGGNGGNGGNGSIPMNDSYLIYNGGSLILAYGNGGNGGNGGYGGNASYELGSKPDGKGNGGKGGNGGIGLIGGAGGDGGAGGFSYDVTLGFNDKKGTSGNGGKGGNGGKSISGVAFAAVGDSTLVYYGTVGEAGQGGKVKLSGVSGKDSTIAVTLDAPVGGAKNGSNGFAGTRDDTFYEYFDTDKLS